MFWKLGVNGLALEDRSCYIACVALQCNIDQRGRMIRFRIGLCLLALALLLALGWALPFASKAGAVVAVLVALAGIGSCIEARLGYCVARGAGFRVPF
jgi:uncharacterized membrane protein